LIELKLKIQIYLMPK